MKNIQCKELYQYLSGVLALIGTLVIGAYLALAGYYLKNCCEERKDELETDWMRDPQEQEVHDSLARDEAENELSVRRTGWAAMPVWMRGLLITAALLSSACTHLLLVPFGSPFQQFKLTDHIYELPGGNVLGTVKARGAVGCVCSLSALTIAVVCRSGTLCARPVRGASCVRCRRTSARPLGSACSPSPSSLPSILSSTPSLTGGRRNFGATDFRWSPWTRPP